MKPYEDIVEGASQTGKLDLAAASAEMMAALDNVEVLSGDLFVASTEAATTLFKYLGMLILTVADEIGALPEGLEAEEKSLMEYMDFAHVSALYEQVRARVEPKLDLA